MFVVLNIFSPNPIGIYFFFVYLQPEHDDYREYHPEVMVMDASGWSMDITFEGGSIDSQGYAVGPDHQDTLHKILRYLTKLAGIEEE